MLWAYDADIAAKALVVISNASSEMFVPVTQREVYCLMLLPQLLLHHGAVGYPGGGEDYSCLPPDGGRLPRRWGRIATRSCCINIVLSANTKTTKNGDTSDL